MADTSRRRILMVLCEHCHQLVAVLHLPPDVAIEARDHQREVTLQVRCPTCLYKGSYPLDQSFEVDSA